MTSAMERRYGRSVGGNIGVICRGGDELYQKLKTAKAEGRTLFLVGERPKSKDSA